MPFPNPLGLPDEILGIVENFITVEYASLRKDGTPITLPIAQFASEDGYMIEVSTGLAYTAKAQRARNNPKVCYLFSEPRGSGVDNPPTVLIYGHASVRDADLQANTDRYVRRSIEKYPEALGSYPRFVMRRMGWYFSRIWIQVTPLRILWWDGGDLEKEPNLWQAPEGTKTPASDPPPQGKGLQRWDTPPADWHTDAREAVATLPNPILTVVDDSGFPVPFRVRGVSLTQDSFILDLYPTMPAEAKGRACLTFHTHGDTFTWNRNLNFVGEVAGNKQRVQFMVERQVTTISLPSSPFESMFMMLNIWRRFSPRIKREAQRRGQSVPIVHLPS